MNLFTRLSNLMTVNVHSLVDWAEDPERMLTQLVRDMEDALAAAHKQAAAAIAAERGIRRDLERHRTAAQEWTRKAHLALSHNRDDLARTALARKIEHDELAGSLETQHLAAERLSSDVKAGLHSLQLRVTEARRRLTLLRASQNVAQIRLEMGKAFGQGFNDSAFERLANRMVAIEDQLLAEAELRADDWPEFGRLELAKRVEEELNLLKKASVEA